MLISGGVSEEMAAPGTVTLSEIKKTSTTPRIHLYTRLFSCDNFVEQGFFDSSIFYNTEEFTLNTNEVHKMLVQTTSYNQADSRIYLARADDLWTAEGEPYQLCYEITLLTPDVTVIVGRNTSLSLLLKTAQFDWTLYIVTEKEVARLKQPLEERDRVRSQINTVNQATIDPRHLNVSMFDI